MLLTGSQLLGTPVMSLQTGALLATAELAIINPGDLTVIAYEVEGPNLDQRPSFLLVNDIRELSDVGMIIDSSDEFVGAEDVVKLKPLYEMHFTVVDKHVIDEDRKKIGKVTDYTIDADSFIIQQLNVKRPLLKSLSDAELLIHRSQIIEINDKEIIVRSAKNQKTAEDESKVGNLRYVNPFRQKSPQTEATELQPKL